MEDPRENPLGLDGFEFVEFTGPDPQALASLFAAMGFTHLANHRSKTCRRYAPGRHQFSAQHGCRRAGGDFSRQATVHRPMPWRFG